MWTFFIKNYRLAYLIIVLVIIAGTISVLQIPRESNPEVDIPVVIVNTIFPGANGMDVEELVTDILEGERGIKKRGYGRSCG
jgi:multidrug efflux pump subunit AcrB